MRFEFDPAKEERNRRKHKVGFDLAGPIFADLQAVTVHDRFENGEDRWHTFGMVAGTLFLVVHACPDLDDETWIRIIGLRKATSQERQRYEEGNFD